MPGEPRIYPVKSGVAMKNLPKAEDGISGYTNTREIKKTDAPNEPVCLEKWLGFQSPWFPRVPGMR
jgi:hypothetical protein